MAAKLNGELGPVPQSLSSPRAGVRGSQGRGSNQAPPVAAGTGGRSGESHPGKCQRRPSAAQQEGGHPAVLTEGVLHIPAGISPGRPSRGTIHTAAWSDGEPHSLGVNRGRGEPGFASTGQ